MGGHGVLKELDTIERLNDTNNKKNQTNVTQKRNRFTGTENKPMISKQKKESRGTG